MMVVRVCGEDDVKEIDGLMGLITIAGYWYFSRKEWLWCCSRNVAAPAVSP